MLNLVGLQIIFNVNQTLYLEHIVQDVLQMYYTQGFGGGGVALNIYLDQYFYCFCYFSTLNIYLGAENSW